jgi:hypothetical protein
MAAGTPGAGHANGTGGEVTESPPPAKKAAARRAPAAAKRAPRKPAE